MRVYSGEMMRCSTNVRRRLIAATARRWRVPLIEVWYAAENHPTNAQLCTETNECVHLHACVCVCVGCAGKSVISLAFVIAHCTRTRTHSPTSTTKKQSDLHAFFCVLLCVLDVLRVSRAFPHQCANYAVRSQITMYVLYAHP